MRPGENPDATLIPMPKRKYPDGFKDLIDFESGETKAVPESTGERQARLRRQRECRRRSVLERLRRAAKTTRDDALARAFRLAYAGHPFPIYFDVRLHADGVELVERYTLVDAVLSDRLDRPGEVGHKSATKLEPNGLQPLLRTSCIPSV